MLRWHSSPESLGSSTSIGVGMLSGFGSGGSKIEKSKVQKTQGSGYLLA